MAFIWCVLFALCLISWMKTKQAEYLELAKFFAVLSTVSELVAPLYMLIREKTKEINIRNDMNQIELQKREHGQND